MSPVDPSNLDRDIAAIRERQGPEAIHPGDEQPPVDRIPLPSPGLMRITSGGVPIGRMTRLWGGPSTGKSLIGWMIAAAAQRLITPTFPRGLECVYYNIEKQFDPIFTAARGVDIKRLQVVESSIIEEVTRECQLLLGSAHVHILDSCSHASSQDELAGDPGDWHRALDARVWKKCLGFIHNQMDKDANAVVYIDHASEDQTTKSESPLGGRSMEHASSLSIHCKKGSWLFYDDDGFLEKSEKLREKTGKTLNGLKEADGIEIAARVAKSRVCRPLRVTKMRLDLNTFEFDRTFELAEYAQYFDAEGGWAHRTGLPAIAQQTSAKSSWYCIENRDRDKVQGARGLRLRIDADPELAARIEVAMMAGN